jgi:hypothetical protein
MDRPDDYRQATARGTELRQGPTAVSALYDPQRGEIVIRLSTGLGLLITPSETEGLAGADPAGLSDIEITPSGLGLHWPSLDADLYLPALLEGLTGSESWMAARLGAKGGRATTSIKAAAARRNGQLGGRPKKLRTAR